MKELEEMELKGGRRRVRTLTLLEGLKDVRGLEGFGECEAEFEEDFEEFDKFEMVIVTVEGDVVKKMTLLLMKLAGSVR